ncbi:MAG: ribonuclease III [Candidatus Wenzhouxiangella sp. M2_3B_020]
MPSSSTERRPVDPIRGLTYRFQRPELLAQALTHRSRGRVNYERLEFLGDGIVNMVVAEMVLRARPDASEGDLSRLRARLVRERTLAEIARQLDLGSHLLLGPGELKSGGFLRDSILADALEAIVGAVYLDGGFEPARELIEGLMAQRVAALPHAEALKDSKTRLQEYLQARGAGLPEYETVDESGADHDRRFTVDCRVPLLPDAATATAGSRRKAEQAAASLALARIRQEQGE